MNATIQFGNFTHAKCFNCGHLGKIESFSTEKRCIAKNEEGTMSMDQLFIWCPICNASHCEALYANEVN